jgi:hypothetical protein
MGLEQLEAGGVMGVVGVDVGVEGARVDDQRDRRLSARMISSMRSEMSLRPLRPAAFAPSRRRRLTSRCSSSAARVTLSGRELSCRVQTIAHCCCLVLGRSDHRLEQAPHR